MTATNNVTMMATTMMGTNHDYQRHNLVITFSLLWPSWYTLWPSWFVAVMV